MITQPTRNRAFCPASLPLVSNLQGGLRPAGDRERREHRPDEHGRNPHAAPDDEGQCKDVRGVEGEGFWDSHVFGLLSTTGIALAQRAFRTPPCPRLQAATIWSDCCCARHASGLASRVSGGRYLCARRARSVEQPVRASLPGQTRAPGSLNRNYFSPGHAYAKTFNNKTSDRRFNGCSDRRRAHATAG